MIGLRKIVGLSSPLVWLGNPRTTMFMNIFGYIKIVEMRYNLLN